MTKITVLGAGGRIAKHAIAALLEEPANELTLYLRRPQSLPDVPSVRVQVVEGDVLDKDLLTRMSRDRTSSTRTSAEATSKLKPAPSSQR